MLSVCSRSIGGFGQIANHLDHLQSSVQAILQIAEVQGNAEIWGRFGQESRSSGHILQFHARYAGRAKPHKHW